MAKKKNVFDTIAVESVPSSVFDLSHDVKLSFNMGEIVPFFVQEALPGDIFHIDPVALLRMAPMTAPVMHEVNVKTRFFYVPMRILWAEFQDWITNVAEVAAPYMTIDAFSVYAEVGSIADYLGFPAGMSNGITDVKVSPAVIAAYMKIFDDWFRVKQFEAEQFVPLTSGDNTDTYNYLRTLKPLHTTWEQDYFTSALPSPQQGDAVQIPLTSLSQIDVQLKAGSGNSNKYVKTSDGGIPNAGTLKTDVTGQLLDDNGSVQQGVALDPNGSLFVDIQADAVPLNTLRYAEALQKWLELNERAGDAYIDVMRSHFGVRSSDARLQRAEYIGGTGGNMVISEVLSTAETRDPDGNIVNPVGQMAGHGISASGGNRFSYRAEEHGFVIGVITVTPRSAYSQGVPRMLTRLDRYDYGWPLLANLGEQEIKNKEIYATSANPDEVWGYTPRYSDYKFAISRIAGEFREDDLKPYHFGRDFGSLPALNADFIKCYPTFAPFAVIDDQVDHIYGHIFCQCAVNRKLPYYGIPSL